MNADELPTDISDVDREAIEGGYCRRVLEIVCDHQTNLADVLRVNRRAVLAARVVRVVANPVQLSPEAEEALLIDLADLDPAEWQWGPPAALTGARGSAKDHHYLDATASLLAVSSAGCCTRTIASADVLALLETGRKRVQLLPPA